MYVLILNSAVEFVKRIKCPRKAGERQEQTSGPNGRDTVKDICDAAGAIFSEQGFEKTQLEEVAARAGYTRGAIYAHYASKEDLFLALMEQRVLSKFVAMRQVVEAEPEVSKRVEIFKRWLSTAGDHTWGILMMEFKLYALRRPESREKLQNRMTSCSSHPARISSSYSLGMHLNKATRAGASAGWP